MKILDPDDKVRAAVCKLYGALDYETAAHHVEKEQLMLVADRCKDKKVSHFNHLDSISNLEYSTLCASKPLILWERYIVMLFLKCTVLSTVPSSRLTPPHSDDRDPHATAHFGWIPQELLHAVALSVEVR
jgi:sister-chromatid-cohesion protein PDS5